MNFANIFNVSYKNVKALLMAMVLTLLLLLVSIPIQARPEYIVGLTEQGIRLASVEQIEVGFNYELEKMGKNKDYLLKIKVYPSIEPLTKLLMEHKIQGYFGAPVMVIKNAKEFNSNLLFSPEIGNKAMQRYVILVRKDQGLDQFAKLKNTAISYCTVDEVGVLYLQKLLQDKSLGGQESFFSKMLVKKNPSLAISAVFFKETAAALVIENDFKVAAELNPQLNSQLEVIEMSPEYITNLLALTNAIEGPVTTAELETSVLGLGNAIKSKKLMQSYNYGAMRKIKFEDLNSVRDLVESISKNNGKSK